jgi:hypothetical protein
MIEGTVDLRVPHFKVKRERVLASMAQAAPPRSSKRRLLGGIFLAATGFVGLVSDLRL